MILTKEVALDFTRRKIQENNRPNYPFRSRYRHTLRVLMWAERLQKELGGDLEVLTYSSILHDCSWNATENHAITSYNEAKIFLNQFDLQNDFKEKVLEGVLYHNRNDTPNLCKESYILMDSDELDEVGALCILWDTLAEQHEQDEVSYKSVLLRTKKYIPNLDDNLDKFHFEFSKGIYLRKLKFMRQFIAETEEELENEL